jgi:hypothetical protein
MKLSKEHNCVVGLGRRDEPMSTSSASRATVSSAVGASGRRVPVLAGQSSSLSIGGAGQPSTTPHLARHLQPSSASSPLGARSSSRPSGGPPLRPTLHVGSTRLSDLKPRTTTTPEAASAPRTALKPHIASEPHAASAPYAASASHTNPTPQLPQSLILSLSLMPLQHLTPLQRPMPLQRLAPLSRPRPPRRPQHLLLFEHRNRSRVAFSIQHLFLIRSLMLLRRHARSRVDSLRQRNLLQPVQRRIQLMVPVVLTSILPPVPVSRPLVLDVLLLRIVDLVNLPCPRMAPVILRS